MENVDDFINCMFPPVEDKPGYVWINRRNYEMAKVDLIKERIEKIYEQYRILQDRMPLCKELRDVMFSLEVRNDH